MKIHATGTRSVLVPLLLAAFTHSAFADAVSEMDRVANQTSLANVSAHRAAQTTRIVGVTPIANHNELDAIDPQYESCRYPEAGDSNESPIAWLVVPTFHQSQSLVEAIS